MNDFVLEVNIYDFDKYTEVVEGAKCDVDHYGKSACSKIFFKRLLNLSNNRCFICGHTLVTNGINGIYAEREHLINKKIRNKDILSLKKCKQNIVPICRTCNSNKTHVAVSDELHSLILELEKNDCNEENCNLANCFERFKYENFDFSVSAKKHNSTNKLKFDVLSKQYLGNPEYIAQFNLNQRTALAYDMIFTLLYDNESDIEGLLKRTTQLTPSIIDDLFIEWINEAGVEKNKEKMDNLIETIVLLECI